MVMEEEAQAEATAEAEVEEATAAKRGASRCLPTTLFANRIRSRCRIQGLSVPLPCKAAFPARRTLQTPRPTLPASGMLKRWDLCEGCLRQCRRIQQ